MTIPQLFKWFCKEQKLMPQMQKMYYSIHPCHISYSKDNGLYTKYLTFNEYVERMVKNNGFPFLLRKLFDEYASNMRPTMNYNEFWVWYPNFMKEFEPYFKKWEYFAKNNLIMEDERIKVGNELKYNSWGNVHDIKVTSIDVSQWRICGNIKVGERTLETTTNIGELVDENNSPLKLDFTIKRKRKMYHGQN